MRQDHEDIDLERLLKSEGHRAGDNPWFTRRVLNRLPERQRPSGFVLVAYGLAAVVCVLSWRSLLGGLDGVITVRDLLYIVVMAAVTLYAVVSMVLTVTRAD